MAMHNFPRAPFPLLPPLPIPECVDLQEQCPPVVAESTEGPCIPTQSNATSLTTFLVEQSRLALKQDIADAQQNPPCRDAQLHIDGEQFHTIIMSRPSTWTSFDELKRSLRRLDIVLAPEDNMLGQRPFTEEEVKGKVVVLLKGTWEPNQKGSFNVKCNHAAEGGALGVIIINTQDGLFDIKPRLGIVAPTIPCVTISRSGGDELTQKLHQEPLVLSKAIKGDHLIKVLRGRRDIDHTVGAPSLAINKGKVYFEVCIESLENLKFFVGVANLNFADGNGKLGDINSVSVDGFDGTVRVLGEERLLCVPWDDSVADTSFVVGLCIDFDSKSGFVSLNGGAGSPFPFPFSSDDSFHPAVSLNGKARLRFSEPWRFPCSIQSWAHPLHIRPIRTHERIQIVPQRVEEEKISSKRSLSKERERARSRSKDRSKDRKRDRKTDRRDDRRADRKDDRRTDGGRDRSRSRRRRR